MTKGHAENGGTQVNEIQVFNNPVFGEVRTVVIDNEPWFVGKDVARMLGYAKTQNAIQIHVDEDDALKRGIVDSMGRLQETTVINESGLYSLIMSSKLPTAKEFKRWVTSEVLPTIRRQGSYSVQQPMTPAQLIAAQAQVLVQMEEKMQALQAQTEAVQSQQSALAQKVETAIRVFSRPSEDHWKTDMDRVIKEMCESKRLNLLDTKGKLYRELEHKCGCDVNSRLRCLRQRMKKQGARHRDTVALTKLDAIAADKQLRAAFEGIVREWQARTMVVEGQQEIAVQDAFELPAADE